MAVSVIDLVWKRFPGRGSELLTMLALADWCNDEGGSLYPSIRKLAVKMRQTERQAQRVMRSLESEGWITVVGNFNGGAPGTTRHYRLNVDKLAAMPLVDSAQTGDVDVTPKSETGDILGNRRVTSAVETGDADVTLSVIEPSVRTVSKNTSSLVTYSDDFEQAWSLYPKRPGASKKDAFKAWRARLSQGVTADQMIDGVKRYARYCAITKTEPQYIKQPATFFGPGEHYLADWAVTIGGHHATSNPAGRARGFEHGDRIGQEWLAEPE